MKFSMPSICGAFLATSAALAAGPHAHGVASLDVAVAGSEVTLMLRSPLENYVGFERAPRDDKEAAALRGATASLRSGAGFAFPAPAGCTLAHVRLHSEALSAALLGEPVAGNDAAARRKPSEHADLDAEFSFRCTNMAALDAIEVRLFDSFKRIRRIDAQVAGARGQSAAKLSPAVRRLPLR